MSSGNPFRASIAHNPAASPSVPPTSFITTDDSLSEAPVHLHSGLGDAGAPPLKTKKHVRIESNTTFIPPHPDTGDRYDPYIQNQAQRSDQSNHVESAPPINPINWLSTNMATGNATMPSANDASMSDSWSGSRRANQAPLSAVSPGGAPANPFSRTLASMEPQEKSNEEDRTPAERPALGNSRASLDVESFKNLLMTGQPGRRRMAQPSQATNAPNAINGPQFESSSSTDTSSISRQSLFEPPLETNAESPRTSYERAESDEDDSMGLVSEVKKGKKKPPPAPKHRHGKPVTPRQPQTVAFESFSATELAPSPITRPRDNSDVNKPLPPTPIISPPPLHISTQDITQQQPVPVQPKSSELAVNSESPRPQKKTPPPVPLARRQSQLRSSTVGNRSRSNSSLTISSQHSVEMPLPSPVPNNKDPLSVAKSPPAPPRSRHGARLTDISTSSANSSSTELPQRSDSVRKALGAISSRRSTMDSEPGSPTPGSHRTASTSSNRPASRVVSGEDNANTMPPPPPPPRRRQSNRSSLDQPRPTIPPSPTESRRTSTEHHRISIDSKRRTSAASESSLRREYPSAPGADKTAAEYALRSPGENDAKRGADTGVVTQTSAQAVDDPKSSILDDMEKFQREIEELRQRYSKAG